MRDWRLVLRDMEREEERKRSMVKIVPGELRNQKFPCGSGRKAKNCQCDMFKGIKMSDEIETIDKNPKSWAAWKREAERLQAIIDGIALAAMDSEPVYQYQSGVYNDDNGETDWYWDDCDKGFYEQYAHDRRRILYRHAQPAPERDQVRSEHAEWSQATFGNVGPVGPLKHLRREVLETIAKPHDLIEWADMQFLLWDAQLRAGITDEQITLAMIEKLAVNKQRKWPAPKDGEPRLHIKEQPAPVVPDERSAFNAWNNEDNLPIAGVSAKNAAWLAWQARAAMLQTGNHAEERSMLHVWTNPDFNAESSRGQSDIFNANGWHARFYEQNKPTKFPYDYNPGNSPVIPDGYVMVPKEPTAQMYDAGDRQMTTKQVWDAMLAAATQLPGSEPAAVPGRWIPVSERMPEDRISVILWDAEIGEVTSGHYSHKTQTFYHCGDAIENEITHWMPPPCAPQEVK